MTLPKFEYEIDVQEMNGAPAGRFTHAANIMHLTRRNLDGTTTRFPAPFSDIWGESRSEAARKARDKIEAWIAAQGSCSTP